MSQETAVKFRIVGTCGMHVGGVDLHPHDLKYGHARRKTHSFDVMFVTAD